MNRQIAMLCGLFLLLAETLPAQKGNEVAESFVIEWKEGGGRGCLSAENGKIVRMEGLENIRSANGCFRFEGTDGGRLSCRVDSAVVTPGPGATIVHVEAPQGSFSFFLRDLNRDTPIYIPDYKAVVLPGGDSRSYEEVEREVLARRTRTKIQRIEAEPEASYEEARMRTRRSNVPIWLGLSRDIRMFEITEELPDGMLEDKTIRPIFSSSPVVLPETDPSPLYYRYALGRGVGVMDNITRSLEQGVLPVYRSRLVDDDVCYNSVSFVSLEKSELVARNVEGTHYLIADSRSGGRVFTESHREQLARIQDSTPAAREETVLYIRTEIENRGSVPRYAWIKAPRPALPINNLYMGAAYGYDTESGFSSFGEDRVFCVSQLDGKPLGNEEMAVLLQPGERIGVEFRIPHEPVSLQRAEELARQSFAERYRQCLAY